MGTDKLIPQIPVVSSPDQVPTKIEQVLYRSMDSYKPPNLSHRFESSEPAFIEQVFDEWSGTPAILVQIGDLTCQYPGMR